MERNISLLNNRKPIHYHTQTDAYSVMDLSICSSDCIIDFEYEISEYLYDGDYYPIEIKLLTQPPIINNLVRYKVNKQTGHYFISLRIQMHS